MVKKHAIIFKASGDEGNSDRDPYAGALSALDVDCEVVQVLNFDFLNLDELEKRLENPQSYSGIIFSSPRVVEAVGKCLKDAPAWANLFAFAVGEKTATEVEHLGLKPSGSETGIGSALAEHILKCTISKPLLLPCGNLATNTIADTLREGGLEVDQLVVYQTVSNPELEEKIRNVIEKFPTLDYLLYFSPSGVKATIPLLREMGVDLSSVKFGAIGRTTEAALAEHGGAAFVAEKPTPQHFADALAREAEEQETQV
ncbi:hypothetical protein GE061_009215 [Apolygus lucorum]|uniref:Uroporphyrinogen-III synthase n=1 Tax=Apolygus lucorum TaxID=248454 RepID=A0A6A4K8R2_APOLU|nr:hypothetical protein GE061_009215 [Apolygus lucorum]